MATTLTSVPVVGLEQRQFLTEVTAVQKLMFDQASTYTKLILGVGYVGFFAAWSGTKANLHPAELVCSALLVCLSLFAYITYEIFQAGFLSRTAIDFARTISKPGLEVVALRQYQVRTAKAQERYFKIWGWVYWVSVVTGLAGGSILIVAFLRALFHML